MILDTVSSTSANKVNSCVAIRVRMIMVKAAGFSIKVIIRIMNLNFKMDTKIPASIKNVQINNKIMNVKALIKSKTRNKRHQKYKVQVPLEVT